MTTGGASKGRGRSTLSFHVSNLGFSPGEMLPSGSVQPPPAFPPLVQRPTPLRATELDDYLLALSQEFRGSIRDSPFYLKPKVVKRDIVRYTDRYKQNQKNDQNEQWQPDWSYLPAELKPAISKKRVTKKIAPNVVIGSKRKRTKEEDDENAAQNLQKILQTDEVPAEGEEKKEEGEEDEAVYYDEEEELEDDNDYNFNHYDDGGDKYGDDDDGEDCPVY